MTDDPTRRSDLDDTQAFDEEDLEPDELEEPGGREEPARAHGGGQGVSGGRGAGRPPDRSRSRGFSIDPSLRVRDRASSAFVIGTVLVFLLIFLNALAFGHGGAFSAPPTSVPSVSAGPQSSASPPALESPTASPAGSPGTSPAGSGTPSQVPSPQASPQPSPEPSSPAPAGS